MGLIAADFPLEAYTASGANNRITNPPAIHLMLNKEQLEQVYFLYEGSGGTVSSMLNTSVTGTKTEIQQGPKNKLESAVNDICSAFELTKEELTKACHIQSRKTLYNWIDGKTKPRKPALKRIFELLAAAQAWKHAGYSGEKEQLHQTVLDGQSLFDILNQEEVDIQRILFIGSRLNIMSPLKSAISDPFA